MKRIGAYEARIQFGDLLRRAERGESVAITRNGQHVATLVPAAPERAEAADAYDQLMTIHEEIRREGGGLSLAEILAFRDEGRK